MLSRLSPRTVFFAIFAYCIGLLGFGLLLQHFKDVMPCPMCVMQRYAFLATGLIALIAGMHNPAGVMRRIYAFLTLAASLTGAGIAARQVWLQHFPPQQTVCGPDLAYMLNNFPLGQALPMLFQGAGDCSIVDWTLLGLSIAEWSLLNFVAISLVAVWLMLRAAPERRRFS